MCPIFKNVKKKKKKPPALLLALPWLNILARLGKRKEIWENNILTNLAEDTMNILEKCPELCTVCLYDIQEWKGGALDEFSWSV